MTRFITGCAAVICLATACKKDPDTVVLTPTIGSWQIGDSVYTANSLVRRNANSVVATGTTVSGNPSTLTVFCAPLPTASTTLPVENSISLGIPPVGTQSGSGFLYESLDKSQGNVVYTVTNGKLTIAVNKVMLYDYYSGLNREPDSSLFSCTIAEP
ncbi:MAG: hypothetical protein EOP52_11255 [Sphingobacteriales bacterium]|nr:MAG: hypothetical protein EOP52_11255 [Sphingobacteriales bacterium]